MLRRRLRAALRPQLRLPLLLPRRKQHRASSRHRQPSRLPPRPALSGAARASPCVPPRRCSSLANVTTSASAGDAGRVIRRTDASAPIAAARSSRALSPSPHRRRPRHEHPLKPRLQPRSPQRHRRRPHRPAPGVAAATPSRCRSANSAERAWSGGRRTLAPRPTGQIRPVAQHPRRSKQSLSRGSMRTWS